MGYELLKLERGEGIAVLTIQRPDKLNALNASLLGELERAVAEIDADPDLRAAIVTGSGEKAFVAGADIGELSAIAAPGQAVTLAERGQRIFGAMAASRVPFIAAVNGFALGGGLELALACDIRIASDKAQLGLPEVSLGVLPGYGGTQRLPRLVGPGQALALILSGDRVKADEALRIGLVDRVVPAAELMNAARALASTIAKRGPVAVALAKRAVHTGLEGSLAEGLRFEASQFGICCSTKDMIEGTRAFLEKREARFTGA